MITSNCPKENEFNVNVSKFESFFLFLKRSYKTLLLIVIVIIVSVGSTTLIFTLISNSDNGIFLPSLGSIKTVDVEVYWDSNCENKTELISWDVLEPGNTINTTVYVKSISNVIVTLNINLTDWSPLELSDYINFSWDYYGQKLSPKEVIPVTIMLSASSSDDFVYYLVENEIKNFVVDIHFVASDINKTK